MFGIHLLLIKWNVYLLERNEKFYPSPIVEIYLQDSHINHEKKKKKQTQISILYDTTETNTVHHTHQLLLILPGYLVSYYFQKMKVFDKRLCRANIQFKSQICCSSSGVSRASISFLFASSLCRLWQ